MAATGEPSVRVATNVAPRPMAAARNHAVRKKLWRDRLVAASMSSVSGKPSTTVMCTACHPMRNTLQGREMIYSNVHDKREILALAATES
jgi:hypothetical protein